MESVREVGSEQNRGQKTDQGGRAGIKRAADHNRQFGIVAGRHGSIAREGAEHARAYGCRRNQADERNSAETKNEPGG